MSKEPEEKRTFLILCVFTANLLGLTVGVMFTWSSPVLPKLESDGADNPFERPITPEESSWIGSLITLGAVVGPFFAAFSSEKIGRKYTLIALGVPFLTAFLILAFTKSIALYYFARLFSGLSVGGVFTIVPPYIDEVCDDEHSGSLGASFNIFIVIGLLLSYCVGPFVSILWFSLFCAIFPCVFIILFFIFMPETPQYLIKCGKEKEAMESLRKLRSGGNITAEFEKIKTEIDVSASGSFSEIYKSKENRKLLTISIALVTCQQFTGIDIILIYTQTIFDASGSSIPAELSPIVIGVVQVLGSLITPFIIDRLGWRVLLIISAIGMIISEVPLGLYFFLKDNNHNIDSIFWLPILCLTLYIIFYNIGFGPLPWTIMAEIFPSNLKSLASSLTASCCWALSFILTKFFGSLSEAIGLSGTFWLFSGSNALAILFVYFVVPDSNRNQFKSDTKELKSKTHYFSSTPSII